MIELLKKALLNSQQTNLDSAKKAIANWNALTKNLTHEESLIVRPFAQIMQKLFLDIENGPKEIVKFLEANKNKVDN